MGELKSTSDLENRRKTLEKQRESIGRTVSICGGTGCSASGSEKVGDALKEELDKAGLSDKITIRVN